MKRTLWISLGFFLFLIGALSLILSLVGIDFIFLRWLDHLGRLIAFIIKLLMVIAGIVLIYLHTANWRELD